MAKQNLSNYHRPFPPGFIWPFPPSFRPMPAAVAATAAATAAHLTAITCGPKVHHVLHPLWSSWHFEERRGNHNALLSSEGPGGFRKLGPH